LHELTNNLNVKKIVVALIERKQIEKEKTNLEAQIRQSSKSFEYIPNKIYKSESHWQITFFPCMLQNHI
jgi:hypothetical protein